MDGAEAIVAAGRGGKTSLVIGVQSTDGEIGSSVRYAKHAAKTGADAIIALPPEKANDNALIEYYKTMFSNLKEGFSESKATLLSELGKLEKKLVRIQLQVLSEAS